MDNITRPAEINNQETMQQTVENDQEYTQTQLENIYDYLDQVASSINNASSLIGIDNIYPVGSIYMSVNNVDPSNFIGGEWEQIKDTFLLSAGDNHEAGSTGGSETVTLTVDQIPSHQHYAAANSITYSGELFGASSAGGFTKNQQFKTSATGGGKAHNNMPPYLAVYVWKRIA